MSVFGIQPGDIYCPASPPRECQIEMALSEGGVDYWQCDRHGRWNHPFEVTPEGRFNWLWSDENPPPMPGCPWCDTRNYQIYDDDPGIWRFRCLRQSCGKSWRGTWTRTNHDWKTDRWLIRVPVADVPWASGTVADLECHRRSQLCQMSASACCRWPKSCRAYDPGFTIGRGPTTLPIIWNDGFGWRSGPPDITQIPEHLFEQIWSRWMATQLPKQQEVDDDGCECRITDVCYHE